MTNAVMHFLWDAHNLHLYVMAIRCPKGDPIEMRRPYVILLWSLLGACGTGFVRNLWMLLYKSKGQPVDDQTTMIIIYTTWVIEWGCLLAVLADLIYHLFCEHTIGMVMEHDVNYNSGEGRVNDPLSPSTSSNGKAQYGTTNKKFE